MSDKACSEGGFDQQFEELLGRGKFTSILKEHGPLKRRPPKVSAFDIVKALVFHVQMSHGSFQHHAKMLLGEEISGAALSQRRERLPWEIFEQMMEESLAPLANEAEHPEAFFKGRRLIAGDGTNFSAANTANILQSVPKSQSRRFEAAFAKLGLWTLTELGLHNPIAAAVGWVSENSEMDLAKKVIKHLPDGSLFIGDRYYGSGCFIAQMLEANAGKKIDFVLRLRAGEKEPRLQDARQLKDGSVVGDVETAEGRQIQIREIRAKVRRKGEKKWSAVRLWTSLLAVQEASAAELMGLYAKRWEIEIFYKEIKVDMRKSPLLQSQTPETAMQEVAALIMANAILARQRVLAARKGKSAPLSISYAKMLSNLNLIWVMMAVAQSPAEVKAAHSMAQRIIQLLAADPLPTRRKRTCQRAVRQPVTSWPRLTTPSSINGDLEFTFGVS